MAKWLVVIVEHPGARIFHLPNAAETAALHICEKAFVAQALLADG